MFTLKVCGKMQNLSSLNEKEIYKKVLSELYLEKNLFFDPALSSVFFIEKSWGGIFSNSLKAIMFDVDDTLNPEGSKNLSTLWLENLPLNEGEIKELKELMNQIGKISSQLNVSELEVRKYVNKFGEKLSSFNLRKDDLDDASKNASKELELNPNTFEGLNEIKNLGYSVGLNSGAYVEVVRYLAERLGILKENCFGSVYNFNKNEKFTGEILPRLSFKKVEALEKFLKFYNCRSKFSIFMTDNPVSDSAPSSKAGFRIFVSDNSKGFDEFFVCLPEVRRKGERYNEYEGMEIVAHFLKRWDLLNIIYFLRSPEMEREIIKLCLSLNKIEEEIQKGKNLFENKVKFVSYVESLLSFLSSIYSRNFFGVDEDVAKLKLTNDEEKIKSLTSYIYLRLSEKVPELNEMEIKKKSFLNKIEEVVKKLSSEFYGSYK
ncbi:MAG: hypothetical protein NZ942_02970 [Candidatus Aenigmarchaeota archaeon]|nr:hypothetical protein [Candidatus Aenigmarchaeota archaeon]